MTIALAGGVSGKTENPNGRSDRHFRAIALQGKKTGFFDKEIILAKVRK
jgi:hypothetical protein